MKILLVNRFFFPDTSATSQIATDLASHLAADGWEVHVVTSRTGKDQAEHELCRGVSVHRVALSPTGPHNLLVRTLAYLRFYAAARRRVRTLLGRGDILIVKTDPPMMSAVVGPPARRLGAKVVPWLQDVFPEVAREYGIPGAGGLTGALLRRMRDRSLEHADRIVTIGEIMAERIRALPGVDRARVRVIHNWADGEAIRPVDRMSNPLRRRWDLGERFVVGYSGNLGRVHEFETLLGAARRLQGDEGAVFLIVGRGPRLAEVESAVRREGLRNVMFKPHQERTALSDSLGAPDVHLCVLRPEFEGLIQPSKLYGILAAARPTIFVGAAASETGAILESAQAGLTVPTGDSEALCRAIVRLRDDAALRTEMGRNARRAFERRYCLPLALASWEEVLDELRRGL